MELAERVRQLKHRGLSAVAVAAILNLETDDIVALLDDPKTPVSAPDSWLIRRSGRHEVQGAFFSADDLPFYLQTPSGDNIEVTEISLEALSTAWHTFYDDDSLAVTMDENGFDRREGTAYFFTFPEEAPQGYPMMILNGDQDAYLPNRFHLDGRPATAPWVLHPYADGFAYGGEEVQINNGANAAAIQAGFDALYPDVFTVTDDETPGTFIVEGDPSITLSRWDQGSHQGAYPTITVERGTMTSQIGLYPKISPDGILSPQNTSGEPGVSGSYTTADDPPKTVTVVDGIIVSIA